MKNEEVIKRLLAFDDNADVSTGFVDMSSMENMPEDVRFRKFLYEYDDDYVMVDDMSDTMGDDAIRIEVSSDYPQDLGYSYSYDEIYSHDFYDFETAYEWFVNEVENYEPDDKAYDTWDAISKDFPEGDDDDYIWIIKQNFYNIHERMQRILDDYHRKYPKKEEKV